MVDLSMTEARRQFRSLVRRAASTRERVTITDHGQPAVVLVNAQELADLEDALALAEYDARCARGEVVLVAPGRSPPAARPTTGMTYRVSWDELALTGCGSLHGR
jgi:prevent-host-death family protein